MSFNYNVLKGKITEVCGTRSEFAKRLGILPSSLSARLNGNSDFSSEEIIRSCDILGIPVTDIYKYFFCVDSSGTTNNKLN